MEGEESKGEEDGNRGGREVKAESEKLRQISIRKPGGRCRPWTDGLHRDHWTPKKSA